jgi:hypothetical protein
MIDFIENVIFKVKNIKIIKNKNTNKHISLVWFYIYKKKYIQNKNIYYVNSIIEIGNFIFEFRNNLISLINFVA